MKYPKKQQGKYAYLEQLTTEELDELLRLEFNANEEDADPELVLAIMEVIAEREPEDIPPIDPEETWDPHEGHGELAGLAVLSGAPTRS